MFSTGRQQNIPQHHTHSEIKTEQKLLNTPRNRIMWLKMRRKISQLKQKQK